MAPGYDWSPFQSIPTFCRRRWKQQFRFYCLPYQRNHCQQTCAAVPSLPTRDFIKMTKILKSYGALTPVLHLIHQLHPTTGQQVDGENCIAYRIYEFTKLIPPHYPSGHKVCCQVGPVVMYYFWPRELTNQQLLKRISRALSIWDNLKIMWLKNFLRLILYVKFVCKMFNYPGPHLLVPLLQACSISKVLHRKLNCLGGIYTVSAINLLVLLSTTKNYVRFHHVQQVSQAW